MIDFIALKSIPLLSALYFSLVAATEMASDPTMEKINLYGVPFVLLMIIGALMFTIKWLVSRQERIDSERKEERKALYEATLKQNEASIRLTTALDRLSEEVSRNRCHRIDHE